MFIEDPKNRFVVAARSTRLKEVEAPKPFTLESLIAWLEKFPADHEYEYMDCNGACLFGQYMAEHGMRGSSAFNDNYLSVLGLIGGKVYPTQEIAREHPHTFGAALIRARSYLTSSAAKQAAPNTTSQENGK